MLKFLTFFILLISAALSQPVSTPPLSLGSGGGVIGTPQSLGKANASTSAITIPLTMTQSILTGDLVIVCMTYGPGGVETDTMTDGTNTYTLANQQVGSANVDTFYKANATAVSSGNQIVGTLGVSHGFRSISAFRVAGIAVSPLDKFAGNSTSDLNSVTVSTGTLSQANELVTGCNAGTAVILTSYSGAAGFTNVNSQINPVSTQFGEADDFKIVNSTSTVSYTPTWVTSGGGQAIDANVVSFKGH